MQLHQLKPKTANYKYPRVGRGGKRGKTAGKGTKGQKARAGRKLRPELRDIIKKFPKVRGYRFKSIHDKPATVNVGDLKIFAAGVEVTPETLVAAKLIRREHGAVPAVKILGDGELTHALKVSGCTVSASAKVAIEKAGGTVAPMWEKPKTQKVKVATKPAEPKAPKAEAAPKEKKDKKEKKS